MEKFIIIDGNSLANRAFYAMPYLSNKNNQPSGAIFGFANLLVKLIEQQRPEKLAVAFDHARKTFRNEIYAMYKGTRKETPPDLLAQFPLIKQMLQKMGITVLEHGGIEADDIIGTLAKNSNHKNILVSGDRDLLQLIDSRTEVWLTRKGVSEIEKFDEVALQEKLGLTPSGIVELKALMGDSSDNIPGVAGVGEKTALSLLHEFGTLDGVYQNLDSIKGKLREKLELGRENAYMSKTLATIKTDCELPECDFSYDFPFSQQVRDFFEEWDFRSLLARKDIFLEGVHSASEPAKRVCIDSLNQLRELRPGKFFCYDLQNLEFSFDCQNVYFIKKEVDLFSEILDMSAVLGILKNIFEDEKILKITNSSKEDVKTLQSFGVELNNFFDLQIAQYVLYAGLPKKQQIRLEDFLSAHADFSKKMKEQGVEKIFSEIEIPLVKVLAAMEKEGFKVDEQELAVLSKKFKDELADLSEKIYQLAGEKFNINSPKQVGEILFDKLGLKSYNNKKHSTNFAVLDDIRWQHEIVELIISHRKLSKLVSTYVNVYENICKTSGNVIHTVFNQTLTSTGRLSSSEPNMQNIPARDEQGRALRKIFISKFPDGQIISADYSQIELRLLANMAGEEGMIEAYRSGVDIHTKTASEIFGVPMEQVSREQRRDAKAVNFGIIYGISDFGLSQNIKTSRFKAKQYMDSYFDRYPKIKTFMQENVEYAKQTGVIKSYFGRIRHVPELSSSNRNVRKFGERVAMNMPLQGTASDVIKLAMIKVFDGLKNMKSHLILQIHDELIVDAPKEEVEQVEMLLRNSMESVCNFEVPLTVSVGSGKNLFECK